MTDQRRVERILQFRDSALRIAKSSGFNVSESSAAADELTRDVADTSPLVDSSELSATMRSQLLSHCSLIRQRFDALRDLRSDK
ncbi:MAG: hypothetical protein NXI31_05970 [bacterium]|nr:hypothetical protein [bacterium]